MLDLRDAFMQFARNNRWGTCGDCPRDDERHVYPEFCKFTDRYDHQLDCGFQARCPHPPKYVRVQWGQYERCCDVCDLCGAELN